MFGFLKYSITTLFTHKMSGNGVGWSWTVFNEIVDHNGAITFTCCEAWRVC